MITAKDRHDIHCQIVKHWTVQEMRHSVNEFRCAIVGCICMLMWELFTAKGVKSIIFVNTKSLDEILPGLIKKQYDQSSPSETTQWEPHWLCADIRERCFKENIEKNMFQIDAPDIWDYTAVLPQTSIWSSNLYWNWFYFQTRVAGFIYRLKDEQESYACTRSSCSIATPAMDENQLRSSTSECLRHSTNIVSGHNKDDSDCNP